jgi:hypothetical protein
LRSFQSICSCFDEDEIAIFPFYFLKVALYKDVLKSFATFGLQRSSLKRGKTAGYINNGTAVLWTNTSGAAK